MPLSAVRKCNLQTSLLIVTKADAVEGPDLPLINRPTFDFTGVTAGSDRLFPISSEHSLDFLKVARSLLVEWTWHERLLSLAARQIYRRNVPPVALSNQKQRYESTRQSSQIITRSRAMMKRETCFRTF